MAMTNLIYNPPSDIHSPHPLPPPPQPPKYTNYPTTNLSNLSPIYEGEIFASPTNTISPSISHNTIDNNHVALFNGNINPPNTHMKISSDQISPTTSISSSNSSNTPTPTTIHTTSNSLFNIPSTNNNPPCIPSVGLMNANISKTSTSSSSPSPSLDTTVSPVTKMDLFRDLKIFEDTETDEYNEQQNNITIDYLTGDKYINNNKKIIVKNKKHKSKKKNKNKKQKKSKNINIKVNGHSSPYINNNTESDGSSNSNANTPVINGSNVQYQPSVDFPNIYNIPRSTSHINTLNVSVHCNNIPPPPLPQPPLPKPHSPLNKNSLDHKHNKHNKYKRKKIKIKSRRHRDKSGKKKKKKSESHSHCDSDSELQKKGKIRDKIKKISIRVPGDPNGLYKYWKRTSSKYNPHKSMGTHKSPIKDCHLNIFSENKEDELNMKKILNIDESFKLSINPISVINTNNHANRNRDRLNSYPPKNMIYSIKSPHILSSPSSSMSNSNNSMSSMPNIICNKRKIKHIPIKLKKSQSCSNLLSSSIIIHTPTKTSGNNDENKQENCNEMTYNFSVLGLKNYTPNIPKKHRKKKHYKDNSNGNNTANICGYNIMKDYSLNRIRINSNIFPPNITVPSPTHSNTVSPIHTPINDDNKDEEWHYTSKKKKKPHNKNGKYYGMRCNNSYYYTNNYATGPYNKDIPIYKWNDNENDSTEIPSLPIQSLSQPPANRKHININKKYNIHPPMVGTSMGKLYDL